MSDEGLLVEAKDTYGDVIEWATNLDTQRQTLRTIPYKPSISFKKLLDKYNAISNEPFLIEGVSPRTRSQTYQHIEQTLLPIKLERMRALPDLISNLQYAIGTDSHLIVDTNSPYITDGAALLVDNHAATVTIDCRYLFEQLPEIRDAIAAANIETISGALADSRDIANEGWSHICDLATAERYFSKALEAFCRELLGFQGGIRSILANLEPTISATSISAKIPITKLISDLLLEKQLKGMGRFINVS